MHCLIHPAQCSHAQFKIESHTQHQGGRWEEEDTRRDTRVRVHVHDVCVCLGGGGAPPA